MLHHIPFRTAKLRQNLSAQNRIRSANALLHRSRNSTPAYVVRAALIARRRPISARARNFTVSISSERRRTRSRHKNNCRPLASSRQCRIEVGQHRYSRSGETLLQRAAHPLSHVRFSRARQPRANGRNHTSLQPRIAQRQIRAFLNAAYSKLSSNSRWIRWPRKRSRQHRVGGIHQHALRLRPPAIETQDVPHKNRIPAKRNKGDTSLS